MGVLRQGVGAAQQNRVLYSMLSRSKIHDVGMFMM
jgi:hypothetical protein